MNKYSNLFYVHFIKWVNCLPWDNKAGIDCQPGNGQTANKHQEIYPTFCQSDSDLVYHYLFVSAVYEHKGVSTIYYYPSVFVSFSFERHYLSVSPFYHYLCRFVVDYVIQLSVLFHVIFLPVCIIHHYVYASIVHHYFVCFSRLFFSIVYKYLPAPW